MNDDLDIFAKTGQMYLDSILAMPWDRLSHVHNLDISTGAVHIPFFNQMLHVSESGLRDAHGNPQHFDVAVVVYRYLLMCPDTIPKKKDWTAFRDFKDAGPLTVYFSANVEQEIIKNFHDPRKALDQTCRSLGGYTPEVSLSHDLVMAFDALPNLPVFLLFNYPDEDFPASCSVLFEARAEKLLDPESLAILGAIFARHLTNASRPD